jgi:hypothetical protein
MAAGLAWVGKPGLDQSKRVWVRITRGVGLELWIKERGNCGSSTTVPLLRQARRFIVMWSQVDRTQPVTGEMSTKSTE